MLQASEPFIRLLQSDLSILTPSKQRRSSILMELFLQALPLLESIPPLFSVSEVNFIRQVWFFVPKE